MIPRKGMKKLLKLNNDIYGRGAFFKSTLLDMNSHRRKQWKGKNAEIKGRLCYLSWAYG